jgi:opacity protein-like surface antigen
MHARFHRRRAELILIICGLSLFFVSELRAQTVTEPSAGTAPATREADRNYNPGEWYVAGFGGYTFGHGFNDAAGTGLQSGTNVGNRDLANSVAYGVKVGRYFAGRLNWLGIEVEGYNSTPHIKQSGAVEGSHLRVTTLGINLVARVSLWCGTRRETDRDRSANWGAYQDGAYCPVQPYAGLGIGTFFARASDRDGGSSDVAPGWNVLAGVRYFVSHHVAVFGEYKHNLAFLQFQNIEGRGAGFEGWYNASHVVGGLSLHF